MDRLGIRLTLLMPPPQPSDRPIVYDCDALRFVRRDHADRFRLLGGGASLNSMIQDTAPDDVTERVKQRFRARAEEVIACGIVGFGEITAHHMSLARMGSRHPYERAQADHPLLLQLADIAAEKDMPIDLHLDMVPTDMPLPDRPIFNSTNPRNLKANLAAFERLLEHNSRARIIWAHAGSDPLLTRTIQVQRDLLARHPNLYMSLRPARGGPPPAIMLNGAGQLKPDWLALLQEFPDRFVMGSDQFHPPYGAARRTPQATIENLPKVLEQLPPALARAISYENPQRLYRLDR
jgi:predicted TIM-barrel fold metal-dependent hydrolase